MGNTSTREGLNDRLHGLGVELGSSQAVDGWQKAAHVSLLEALSCPGSLPAEIPHIATHVKLAIEFAENIVLHGKAEGLRLVEIAAIHLYTQEWANKRDNLYWRLNATLRDTDCSKCKLWFCYMRILYSGLNKLKRFKGEVFRDIGVPDQESLHGYACRGLFCRVFF